MFRPSRSVLMALFVAAFTAGPAVAANASPAPLRKGDRIVFFGDALAADGEGLKGFVTLIQIVLREKHKDLGVEGVGAGVAGDRAPDLQDRLEKDVLAKKPTLVVIAVGVNDVWRGDKDPARGTPKDRYEAALRDVIGRCQAAGARVVLCTPAVIGEKNDASNPDDARLDEYAEVGRAVAKDLKAAVCDLRKEFQTYETNHNPDNKESGVLTIDGVHLNDAGHQLVADALLKLFGV